MNKLLTMILCAFALTTVMQQSHAFESRSTKYKVTAAAGLAATAAAGAYEWYTDPKANKNILSHCWNKAKELRKDGVVKFAKNNPRVATALGLTVGALAIEGCGDEFHQYQQVQRNNALQQAVAAGSLEHIGILVRAHADVNAHGHDGLTPLIRAIESNNQHVTAALLAHGAALTVRSKQGQLPFDYAFEHQKIGLLPTLAAAGGRPSQLPAHMHTPLQWALMRRDLNLVTAYIARGENINEAYGDETPLTLAASYGNDTVVTALLAAGADRQITPEGYYPALNAAVRNNCLSTTQLLLTGATDTQKNRALLTATRYDVNNRVIQAIISSGAHVGHAALYEAFDYSDPSDRYSEYHRQKIQLLIAAGADINAPGSERYGHILSHAVYRDLAKVRLALSCGADVNLPADNPPLLRAVLAGKADIVHELLSHHAIINAQSATRAIQDAFRDAADKANIPVIEQRIERLIAAGVDVNSGVTSALWGAVGSYHQRRHDYERDASGSIIRDDHGRGVILDHNGRTQEQYEADVLLMVQKLIAAGANVNAAESSGWNVLLRAAGRTHPACVRELILAGADTTVIVDRGETIFTVIPDEGHTAETWRDFVLQALRDRNAQTREVTHRRNLQRFNDAIARWHMRQRTRALESSATLAVVPTAPPAEAALEDAPSNDDPIDTAAAGVIERAENQDSDEVTAGETTDE